MSSPLASDAAGRPPAGEDPAWSWQQAALEDIARLTIEPLSSREFHAAVLARAIPAISALAGAVWLRTADGSLVQEAECQWAETDLHTAAAASDHQRLVAEALRGEVSLLVLPGERTRAGEVANPSRYALVFAPLRAATATIGVLELVANVGASPATRDMVLQFVSAAAELAGDYHRQQQVRQLTARETHWLRLETFLEQIHASLELQPTSYAIANEGRRWIGCDRVSLVTIARGRCRLRAASGVERIEERSDAVRRIEALGAAVARIGEPLWFPSAGADLPPQLDDALQAHLDTSHARLLAAVPLRLPSASAGTPQPPGAEVLGVLLVEQFNSATGDTVFHQRVETAARHATVALKNSLEFEALPLLPLEKTLQSLRWLVRVRQLPKTALALALAVAAVLVLVLVPADFNIEARGELQPRLRREIFAPADAIVSVVRVAAGQHVRAGDMLLQLRKPELEVEIQRVLGEMQTARKKLAAIQAARLSPERSKPDGPERYQQLAAEEEEIKESLASLEQQDKLLRNQQMDLAVTSPIDGEVLTWDVDQLLATRPVQRGQKLLSVGDVAGSWELDLRLPDHHAGYVLEAREGAADPLNVTYLLATDPGTTYAGHVEKIALAAANDAIYGANVPVTVAIDGNSPGELHPGATVIGKIHCGRRSLGFVWFHDLIAVIRTKLLF